MFAFSIRSEVTRKYYERRLRHFFNHINFDLENSMDMEVRCNNFSNRGKNDANWAIAQVITFLHFQKERVQKGEITASTLRNFIKAIKLFCDSCDLDIPWKKLMKGLPRAVQAANDRAPTIEEIQKLIEYPDRRIKPVVYTMVSSGIRLGAWDYLKWKHVTPVFDNDGNTVLAAKLKVYEGDVEEYYSFITPEAYKALEEWMDFRASYGEDINGESWLMRDLWQTTNVSYGARWGLATVPKKIKNTGIKRMLERALWDQGIRNKLKDGAKRHEFKAAHGFRKFYKSRAEQVMRPINVEITMGHNIGLSDCYYRPTEKEVSNDYLKAVDLLTINSDGVTLKKQVQKLREDNQNNEYIIKGRLQEKEDQIKGLEDNVKLLKEGMNKIFMLIQQNPTLANIKPEILNQIET
jgi:integrase